MGFFSKKITTQKIAEFKAKQEKREIDLVKNREWETQSLCIIKGLRKEGAEKFFKGIGNLREAFRSRLSKFWS
ncbi:MAG: hypothetical protein COT33_03130 [Candidatus Nealsonbacteria bacterium CG08_land_8_20_14_0_20_38_20]|uniref:Uncharacterized protein n=1 Tax=Candidatus Nealsonbacteria bacterium CG08_land_8_20_14_0_20_38_20 TaxID=1974705 RepID=A0A2H0YLU0_9BACT|nr:MAG: hypothetical protein COT33_03130 [Candidatus Nealsonbacteria bacterium CG08_land_8_20_14_0_20_38_20]